MEATTTFWFFGNDRRAAIHPSFGFLFTKWNDRPKKQSVFGFLVFGWDIIQAGGNEQRINRKEEKIEKRENWKMAATTRAPRGGWLRHESIQLVGGK